MSHIIPEQPTNNAPPSPSPDSAASNMRLVPLYAALAAAIWWPSVFVFAATEWEAFATRLPLGADYLSFYAASALTLAGAPASVYDLATHEATQKALFSESGYSWFLYPPIYLLICWPLALAPFFMSLGVWLAATFAGWLAMARAFAPPLVGVAPFVAAPALMVNVAHGQNAFLTCALLGAGCLCLARRPALAGVLFGCLAFKPHLALLVPVLLAAGGRWRAFLYAGGTALGLASITTIAFGASVWSAYLAALPEARRVLELGVFGHEKLQSVFAMARMAGASADAAYAAQSVAALIVAVLLAMACRRRDDPLACGALMCAGVALVTPFILRYDLVLLTIPLMWLVRDGRRRGVRLHEALIMLAAYMLPFAPLELARTTGALVAPLVMAALFAIVLQRVLEPTKKGEPKGSPS